MLLEVTNQIWKSMVRLLEFLLFMSVKSFMRKLKLLQFNTLLKWQIMHFCQEEYNWKGNNLNQNIDPTKGMQKTKYNLQIKPETFSKCQVLHDSVCVQMCGLSSAVFILSLCSWCSWGEGAKLEQQKASRSLVGHTERAEPAAGISQGNPAFVLEASIFN